MMNRKNKSLYAILGYLATQPMSGYDIKKAIDSGIRHFWNESYGQLYPILKQLVREELAVVEEVVSSKGRTKKEYSITEKGRKALQTWLTEPIEKHIIRDELLLKLYFGEHIGEEASIEHIETLKNDIQSRLNTYKEIEQFLETLKHKKSAHYWLLTLRHGIIISEAKLKWCEECIERLNELRT